MSYDEDYLFALQLQNELDALDESEALPEVQVSNIPAKNCICDFVWNKN